MPVSCHFRGCKVPLSSIVSGTISSELPLPFTFTYVGLLVTLTFDPLTLELVWNVSHGTDNLQANFGVFMTFCF